MPLLPANAPTPEPAPKPEPELEPVPSVLSPITEPLPVELPEPEPESAPIPSVSLTTPQAVPVAEALPNIVGQIPPSAPTPEALPNIVGRIPPSAPTPEALPNIVGRNPIPPTIPTTTFQPPVTLPTNTQTIFTPSLTETLFTEAKELAITTSNSDSPVKLDDFQLRRMPSLETPNFALDSSILKIDESITSDWLRSDLLLANGIKIQEFNPQQESNIQLEKTANLSIVPIGNNTDTLTINQELKSQFEQSYINLETTNFNSSQSDLILGYGKFTDELFSITDVAKIVWRIEQARNQEFENHLGFKENYPNLRRMQVEGIQETLKTVEKETKKRSVIIYILARIDQLELILVPALGQPIRYTIPEAKKAVLLPIVNQLRSEITNSVKRGTSSYKNAAEKLYKWMIAPLEKDLKSLNIETLLLSVDPGLRSMPFAALYDGKQFLIEKYSLSLIPSFSLMDTHYASLKNASVLAMGASEFTDKNPLPAVPIELKTIVTEWQGQSFLNTDFTLNNLQSQRLAQPFRIVHLATHSEFNPGFLSNSYIQLWNEKLSFDRLETLGWDSPPVDLLVLSSCRTAFGNREAELGFAGLAVQSGARSALASLWNVDDRGTLGLMSAFYQELRSANIKAEALRFAQIAMISGKVRIERGKLLTESGEFPLSAGLNRVENTLFSHPYYWSGFTLVGNPW